jgi:hypothetical protein
MNREADTGFGSEEAGSPTLRFGIVRGNGIEVARHQKSKRSNASAAASINGVGCFLPADTRRMRAKVKHGRNCAAPNALKEEPEENNCHGGGQPPHTPRSCYRGRLRRLALFGGCGDRSKTEFSPTALPSPSFSYCLPTTLTGHRLQRAPRQGKGRRLAHYRRGL